MAISLTYKTEILNIGDTVAVYQNIVEGEKTRLQMFEGVIIAIQNREENKTMVIRKIATGGIGVEKIIPVMLPSIEKIVVKRRGVTRRAKLYHLRERIGKNATKLKEKKTVNEQTTNTQATTR